MDPSKAVDLDPVAKGSAVEQPQDEAPDAPKTVEEVEKKPAPPQPQLATTLHDAVELIQQGKRDLALASLRQLRKKSPKSSYIPFLLGNLYYDQRWWSVSMDDYAAAIKNNPAYRTNSTLNRNVIRMLSSTKTQQRAANFLRGTIGRPALPYLKAAAAHEDNPVVKKQAAILARVIR
jgi:eukaryotic-like serine/threonine-protein kinase